VWVLCSRVLLLQRARWMLLVSFSPFRITTVKFRSFREAKKCVKWLYEKDFDSDTKKGVKKTKLLLHGTLKIEPSLPLKSITPTKKIFEKNSFYNATILRFPFTLLIKCRRWYFWTFLNIAGVSHYSEIRRRGTENDLIQNS
jgi:hypothetical protein